MATSKKKKKVVAKKSVKKAAPKVAKKKKKVVAKKTVKKAAPKVAKKKPVKKAPARAPAKKVFDEEETQQLGFAEILGDIEEQQALDKLTPQR